MHMNKQISDLHTCVWNTMILTKNELRLVGGITREFFTNNNRDFIVLSKIVEK